jgi:hypothetical protein
MHNELSDHSANEDSEEFVRRTIIWDDEFSFQADLDVTVLHEEKRTNIIDAFADEIEVDTPLKFQRFILELLAKLRLKMLSGINDDDILLQDVPGSISRGELLDRSLFD